MQRYRVTVPAGVSSGMPFLVNVGGQQMRVTCPQGVGPGMQIEIQAPAVQGQVPQQQQYSPPPVPQQASMPSAVGAALGPQCQQSKNAEQQLASLQGPPPPGLIFRAMDRDGSGSVSVEELQFGLSSQGRLPFVRRTCQLLVNLYDSDRTGSVNEREFSGLWKYIDEWRVCFNGHDKDKSGRISKDELKHAIEQIGYRFSSEFFDKMWRAYDQEKRGDIGFDQFVQIFCELHMLTESFKNFDRERNGTAVFQYEQFLDAAFSLHT